MSARDSNEPQPPSHQKALAALQALPPLSNVAIRIQLLAKEDLAVSDAAEMIMADAALSADVLFLANSPLFGLRQTATGIVHAVALIGLHRVMKLVVTAALRAFGSPARGTPALNRCWRHNLACGLICDDLAHRVDLDSDVAYTAGLLHDIGRCGMLCAWTKRYGELLDAATADPLMLLTSEREELGISHTDAGAVLLRNWALPETLVESARLHHDRPAPDVTDYIGIVHCGCAMADKLGFVVTGKGATNQMEDAPPPWSAILAGLPEQFAQGVAERVHAMESYVQS